MPTSSSRVLQQRASSEIFICGFMPARGVRWRRTYSELCNLLNVQVYPHLSKIKSTMGLALNELVKIKYISKWDVQKMSSKLGYKIVLTLGRSCCGYSIIVGQSSADNRRNCWRPRPASSVSEPTSKEQQQAIKMLPRACHCAS